ncbi:MAG: hypothetical protein KIT31_11660 [Deltaproteobacteria bacterium]|nr:hypothetical protein [Deltaproteobacteria bacterium]
MSWADLDRLAAKARPDGGATLVVRDDRTPDRMLEQKHLSIVVAISRVVRGRRVLAERHDGRGAVVYATRGRPPEFLIAAVTAAGGVVFDGVREHSAHAPLAATVQLDAAFTDLASAVRRRLGAKSFRVALDTLEYDVRGRPPDRADPEAWWAAIIELAALAGECVRERRGARWTEAPAERLPLALDLGKGGLVFPGRLAQAIVEGGGGSMTELLEAALPAPVAVAATPARAMPILCDRRTVPLAELTWERLVAEEADTDDLPVVVYVEDRGGTLHGPPGPRAPAPELRERALANLAAEPVDVACVDLPGGDRLVVVTGAFAAESLLDPATMASVRAELGGPGLMFVGVPARGRLVAVDGERATIDDDLQREFLLVVEQHYLEAPERDRISRAAITYVDRPLGRVPSNLLDERRAAGVDPDA